MQEKQRTDYYKDLSYTKAYIITQNMQSGVESVLYQFKSFPLKNILQLEPKKRDISSQKSVIRTYDA
jgi:hypothetical protein